MSDIKMCTSDTLSKCAQNRPWKNGFGVYPLGRSFKIFTKMYSTITPLCQNNSSESSPVMCNKVDKHMARDLRPFFLDFYSFLGANNFYIHILEKNIVSFIPHF